MSEEDLNLSCPFPINDYPTVQMAHGGGGRLMNQLLDELVIPGLGDEELKRRHDGAVLETSGERLAYTTDSYVVDPLFFSGGNIGTLAVNGTVNDLAMCAAEPKFITTAFILEEGFPMEDFKKIIYSIKQAAEAAGVKIVSGDTKVVQKGRGDGIYINTSGIGFLEGDVNIGPGKVEPGDALVVSGDVGRHGMAVMADREGLEFETDITSDCAPLNEPVRELLAAGIDVHFLRDLTRGGLASVTNELAEQGGVGIELEESAIPVHPQVKSSCEILGFDPLYVASEGCMIVAVPQDQAEEVVESLGKYSTCERAARVGRVVADPPGRVELTSTIGASRLLEMLSGEQLPRIC
ncbi:MAG: hydrogenase expression/formation protein HypE [bacterium]